jgi:hypothetical protein
MGELRSINPDVDPDLVEAPAVLARFQRALNLSMLALIGLALV